MKQRLQAYLKEYEMLTAENRLWLGANDPKLTVAFTACIGLAGAGVWKNMYALFLVIPFVVVFLAFILLYQFSTIVLLAAQLAVLEERINSLLGAEPTLTYFSRTVITIFDRPFYRDPQTGRKRTSLNIIYGCLVVCGMVCGSIVVLCYAVPKLAAQSPRAAVIYASLLGVAVILLCLLFIRIGRSKHLYMNVIRDNFIVSNKTSNNRIESDEK